MSSATILHGILWVKACAKCADKIMMHICMVSSGPLQFIDIVNNIQRFSELTVKALIRLQGCAGRSRLSLSNTSERHMLVSCGLNKPQANLHAFR